MARRVVVIGAGVTGSAVAAELSAVDGLEVTVLERGPAGRLVGSTGHAPGFVGLLGEAPVLTELARVSAATYEVLHHRGEAGFDRAGGLELVQGEQALEGLGRRAEAATDAGLPVQVLDAGQAARVAPDLVDPAGCAGGLLFAQDGTARARVVTAALQDRARGAGARFRWSTGVTAVEAPGRGPLEVRTTSGEVRADDVVVACGIWGREVAALVGVDLPVVPVAHPYVHGPLRAAVGSSPFVRWPEHHVYARDHGDRLGLGTYDHTPVPVTVGDFGDGAELPWPSPFDGAVERALRLLPAPGRFTPETRLNGVFSMTPDNRPLLGPAPGVPGVWVAEALWVTHAAGAARALAAVMTGAEPPDGLDALAPGRFAGRPEGELTAEALRLYRDIYATA